MTDSFTVEVEYELICASCGDDLDVEGSEDKHGVERIKVLPCSYCIDMAKKND